MIRHGRQTPRPPSQSALLDAWDRGRRERPAARALLLLSVVEADCDREDLRALTIGQQNERLLRLRTAAFGERLEALVDCPACGDALELTVHASDLLATADAGDAREESTPPELRLETQFGELRFQLPTVADVSGVLDEGAAAPAALLERCRVDAGRSALPLTPELVEQIASRMAASDPLADPELALTCPACGHEWAAPLDVPAYLWMEIDAWAMRTLAQVHRLASAYGWSEAEILMLSADRRQSYLDLLGQ